MTTGTDISPEAVEQFCGEIEAVGIRLEDKGLSGSANACDDAQRIIRALRSALTASEKDAARYRDALSHARVWIIRKQAELSARVYRADEMKDSSAWDGIGDGQFNGDWASINEIIEAAKEKANG